MKLESLASNDSRKTEGAKTKEVEAPNRELPAKLKLFGNRLVTGDVRVVEVIQQFAALADHHQQSAPGTVVFFVALQMLGEQVNPLGQKCDLHIRRPRILFMQSKAIDRFRFRFHSSVHLFFNEGKV